MAKKVGTRSSGSTRPEIDAGRLSNKLLEYATGTREPLTEASLSYATTVVPRYFARRKQRQREGGQAKKIRVGISSLVDEMKADGVATAADAWQLLECFTSERPREVGDYEVFRDAQYLCQREPGDRGPIVSRIKKSTLQRYWRNAKKQESRLPGRDSK